MRGHCIIYKYNDISWVQLGHAIDGKSLYDYFGNSVSLNSSGDRVAIGAPRSDNNLGYCKIYEYDSTNNWSRLGDDIDGEATDDYFGESVSLNSSGDRVAIGAPRSGNNSGYCKIYEYDSTNNWSQLGDDIDGSTNDHCGVSVSLNGSGDIVAIGTENGGKCKIYQYKNTSWIQLGLDINAESRCSVSLNSDGTRVTIGAVGSNNNHIGHCRIYELNNNTWVKIGEDIDGEAAYDKYGYSVSLNSAGNRVAIGGPYNYDNGRTAGHCRILEFK